MHGFVGNLLVSFALNRQRVSGHVDKHVYVREIHSRSVRRERHRLVRLRDIRRRAAKMSDTSSASVDVDVFSDALGARSRSTLGAHASKLCTSARTTFATFLVSSTMEMSASTVGGVAARKELKPADGLAREGEDDDGGEDDEGRDANARRTFVTSHVARVSE